MLFYLSDGYLLGMGGWLVALGASLLVCLKLRRRWKGKPRRITVLNAALSVWMFLATITAIELGFALFYDQSDSFNMTNVSKRWFQRHVELNPEGYRDLQPLVPSPPERTRRILFMGDSFTFGHGVVDVASRFSDRIATSLERAKPGKYVVANLGVPGLELDGLTKLLETKVLDAGYRADMVVYTICLNDIMPFHNQDDAAGKLHDRIDGMQPQFLLFRDTYFLNLVYFRLQQFRRPEVRGYYAHLQDSYRGRPWQRMREKLDELQQICREHRVDLRIAIFPFLHNLGPDYPFHHAHQVLVDYCHERKIPMLDLEPVLAPHVNEGLTVNRFDAHPNSRAHELAAEAMERELLGDLFRAGER